MRTFKTVLLLLFLSAVNAWGADLTPAQNRAKVKLYSYLEKENFHPEADEADKSIIGFRHNGVFYWVKFSEDSPILYTINHSRKGLKIGTDFMRKPAITAANEINIQYKGVKVTVGEKTIDMAIQVYMATPDDFIAVLKKYLSMFDGIDENFRKAYQRAINIEKESEERMEEELRKNLPPSDLRNTIENVSIRLVDASGNETTAYDQPLRSFKANFIQARLEFKPWKEKSDEFVLQLRVFQPNGKPLYLPGKRYTAEMTVNIEKSKKNQYIEFDQFGTDTNGFWKAGEYKLEVLEGGDVIYTTTFNIL